MTNEQAREIMEDLHEVNEKLAGIDLEEVGVHRAASGCACLAVFTAPKVGGAEGDHWHQGMLVLAPSWTPMKVLETKAHENYLQCQDTLTDMVRYWVLDTLLSAE